MVTVAVNDYQTQGRDPTRAREGLLMIHSFPPKSSKLDGLGHCKYARILAHTVHVAYTFFIKVF